MVVNIGKCSGCNKFGKLNQGGCKTCIESPNRGYKWIELTKKIRTDKQFAKKCYSRLPASEQERFLQTYGLIID